MNFRHSRERSNPAQEIIELLLWNKNLIHICGLAVDYQRSEASLVCFLGQSPHLQT